MGECDAQPTASGRNSACWRHGDVLDFDFCWRLEGGGQTCAWFPRFARSILKVTIKILGHKDADL